MVAWDTMTTFDIIIGLLNSAALLTVLGRLQLRSLSFPGVTMETILAIRDETDSD